MIEVSWATCLLLSGGGVGSVTLIGTILSDEVRRVFFNIGDPVAFFWFLLTYGLPAALSIGVIAAVIKAVLFMSGNVFIWLDLQLNQSYKIPGVEIPVSKSEIKKVFKVIEKKLDKRNKELEKAGIFVKKSVENGGYFYRYYYKNSLVYHFSMKPTEDGLNRVGFLDGYIEPHPNTYTAFGKIYATLSSPKPVVSITNLSLIEHNGIPLASGLISYEDLAERIWSKISKVLETRSR